MSAAGFWDKIADKYAARVVPDQATYGATLDIVRGVLPRDANVIELGCGTGTSALRLAGDVGQILGTDYAARMIEIARQKVADADVSNVRFEVAKADADMGSDFDAVIALNLLHLLDDVPRVLNAAYKSLKTGGIIVSKSGCLGSGAKHLLRVPIGLMRMIGKAPYVAFHSAGQLDAMFVAAGFKVEHTEMLPAKSINRVIVARKI